MRGSVFCLMQRLRGKPFAYTARETQYFSSFVRVCYNGSMLKVEVW